MVHKKISSIEILGYFWSRHHSSFLMVVLVTAQNV